MRAMLDWNDLRYFLAVAEQRQHARRRPRAARQPDHGRPPHRRARGSARPSPVRPAPGRLRADPRRARRCSTSARAVERGRDRLRRSRRRARPRRQRHRPPDHAGDFRQHLARRRCCASCTTSIPRSSSSSIPQQELRDLGAGEADIALRSTRRRQPAGVVGRRLCIDDWTLYCSREYAARHGVPADRARTSSSHAIIGGGGGKLWRALRGVAARARARGPGRDAPRHLDRPAVGGPLGLRHRGAAVHRRRRRPRPDPLPAAARRPRPRACGC